MPDHTDFLRSLERAGLDDWCAPLEPLLRRRLDESTHGDMNRWRSVVDRLPEIRNIETSLDSAVVTAECQSLDPALKNQVRKLLLQLRPWRKGPFRILDIDIDAEWRSDLKWDRLTNEISPLTGRRVLDVGCGNGYYGFRMIGAGATRVVGIDPTLLFVFQFLALNRFLSVPSVHVLPLRLDELPDTRTRFDTAFSMGVLYHRRAPLEHLAELRASLRPRGELVLETLVFPGEESAVHRPTTRYARMRNVWHLPTMKALTEWLDRAGFCDIRLADVTATTSDEQRTTEWMPFESLEEALDPVEPGRTVEGLPAPIRALVICRSP